MADSDSDVSVGTPKLHHMKQYWRDIDKNPRKFLHYSSELSDTELDALDDSFKEYLEQRKKELNIEQEPEIEVHNDSTLLEESWMRTTTDLSFEMAEKASMMNDSRTSEDSSAIERMIEKLRTTNVVRPASIGLTDMTQLEDVEAPSMMFEATIDQDATYAQLSPVKQMHMNRQSTILEESTIVESDSSKNSTRNESRESYATAQQNNYTMDTVMGSETYKTAAENISDPANSSSPIVEEIIEIDSSDDSLEVQELDDTVPATKSDDEQETMEEFKHKIEDINLIGSPFTLNETIEDSLIIENDESLNESSSAMPEFNDSIERFEFLMNPENFKKMAHTASKALPEKVSTLTPMNDGHFTQKKTNVASPACKQVLFPKQTNSASKIDTGAFKKPINTKLPLPMHKPNRKMFDHIKSPIGTYIKSTPQTFLSSHRREVSKNLADDLYNKNDRDTIYSVKENLDDDIDNYKPSIPMKCGLASKHKQWADERKQVKIPGGQKVGKILCDYSPATVVRHEGRLKTGTARMPSMNPDDTIGNSTFGNMSMQSGDVSLQVLKDARPSNF